MDKLINMVQYETIKLSSTEIGRFDEAALDYLYAGFVQLTTYFWSREAVWMRIATDHDIALTLQSERVEILREEREFWGASFVTA
jgi:hypothetical protein